MGGIGGNIMQAVMVAPAAAAVERIRRNAVCTPRQQCRGGEARTGGDRPYGSSEEVPYLRFGR